MTEYTEYTEYRVFGPPVFRPRAKATGLETRLASAYLIKTRVFSLAPPLIATSLNKTSKACVRETGFLPLETRFLSLHPYTLLFTRRSIYKRKMEGGVWLSPG